MDIVDYPLRRLESSISRFIVPSAALTDVRALKEQIELRRRALSDIEAIRLQLQLTEGRIIRSFPRRGKGRLARRAHSLRMRRGRLAVRPV